MNVVVDTTMWSMALRRRSPDAEAKRNLTDLVNEGRVVMLGPIRQEIISGVTDKRQFAKLKDRLSAFPDFDLQTEHYEKAAECFNACRSKGIQGSHVDFLICAVCLLDGFALYSTDKDFLNYRKYLDIHLFFEP